MFVVFFNTSTKKQNGQQFADNIFNFILLKKIVVFFFVSFVMGPIDNKLSLMVVQHQAIIWSSDSSV